LKSMAALALPRLYAILDPEVAAGRAPEEALRALLDGGAAMIQLRAKSLAPRDFLELARLARAETRARGCRLIVNDRADVAHAREAEGGGADYIGFGPMFGTRTKDTGYAARGIEMLGEIRAAVSLPIVAIGGITEENAPRVWRAGADSVAIISDILQAADIAAKTRRLVANG